MFKVLSKKVWIPAIIVEVVILFGGSLAYQFWWLPKEEARNIACTMEAKVCPDGSAVGRNGPNCDFSPCPNAEADETAGWKTYTNTEYGLEFKYPENFQSGVDIYGGVGFFDKDWQVQLLLGLEAVGDESIKEHLDQLDVVWSRSQVSPSIDRKNIILDGHNAIEYQRIIDGGVQGKLISTFFKLGDSIWSFTMTPGSWNETVLNQQQISIYNKILSTFKFVQPTDETANWKTYRDNTYGFELKYPFNWSVSSENMATTRDMLYKFWVPVPFFDWVPFSFNEEVGSPTLVLTVSEDLDNRTIDQYFYQIYPIEYQNEGNFTEYVGPSKLSDGTPGEIYYKFSGDYQSPTLAYHKFYIFKVGNLFFNFDAYARNEKRTYEIISSLKFLK